MEFIAPLFLLKKISENWNLIFAILIGIGFGFMLERAGFASSKKLVGLFYGYDFTVLKVFFTAAITAMLMLTFSGKFGLIDLNILDINPVFIKAIIIGGITMGIGFIIGGFCPGTALTAAATGKLDGLFFALGVFVGVFLFGEFYSIIKTIHMGPSLGKLLIFNFIGISKKLFILLLSISASGIFYGAELIEKKFFGKKINTRPLVITSIAIIFTSILLFVF